MSGDDVRELWAAVNALRETVAALTVTTGRIEEIVRGLDRLLTDRCTVHGSRINDVANDCDALAARVAELERHKSMAIGYVAGAGAAGAILVGAGKYILNWLLKV